VPRRLCPLPRFDFPRFGTALHQFDSVWQCVFEHPLHATHPSRLWSGLTPPQCARRTHPVSAHCSYYRCLSGRLPWPCSCWNASVAGNKRAPLLWPCAPAVESLTAACENHPRRWLLVLGWRVAQLPTLNVSFIRDLCAYRILRTFHLCVGLFNTLVITLTRSACYRHHLRSASTVQHGLLGERVLPCGHRRDCVERWRSGWRWL